MPRRAREKSSSGIYHIMVRGINRQDIFNDAQDRHEFMATLKKYKDICGYEVYGYCLMSNHVHLLLKEGKETIAQVMKRIGARYVYLYNLKYERCGHLFQDRFKSENVEDDRYLMAVLRYIHQNPLKANIVDKLAAYKWSSYNEYTAAKAFVTDTQFLLNLLNPNRKKALEIFKEFMKEESNDRFLDDEVKHKKTVSDQNARVLIEEITKSNDPKVLHLMNKEERDFIIKNLRENHISIRQLSRLTGLGRGVIEKAMK